MLKEEGIAKIAVAVDARSGDGIELINGKLALLEKEGTCATFIFLHASPETLLKRYSESRRRHPLAAQGQTLEEAIRAESQLLEPISTLGHRIDTSNLKANALREWIRQFIEATPGSGLTLMFESFGFKHGIPLDADFVFDVRCLPNPHYDVTLKPLTGRDGPVIAFLQSQSMVQEMLEDIRAYVAKWLPSYIRDNRNYFTVGLGCTGGQHRSVYFAETLADLFSENQQVLIRHRELG
jgi:UPF0042 nucleotide-binding protein